MQDKELYYETVDVAISNGDVPLLLTMWKQSLDFGSTGQVIRAVINKNLCAIQKTAGLDLSFQELVERYRLKKVDNFLESEDFDGLVELSKMEPDENEFMVKRLLKKKHALTDWRGLTRLIYALIYQNARDPEGINGVRKKFRNKYAPGRLPMDTVKLLPKMSSKKSDVLIQDIGNYLAQLIVENDDVQTYQYFSRLEYPDVYGGNARSISKRIEKAFLEKEK